MYQEPEPLVATGVAAALQLAGKKGFVVPESAPKKETVSMPESSVGRRDV